MSRNERRIAAKSNAAQQALSPAEQQALQLAVSYHQQNQLAEAENIYRQILQANPRASEAMHLLGVLAHQVGQHDMAEELITQSIAINGTNIDAYANLANVYQAQGRFEEAEDTLRKALKLNGKLPTLWFNLGNLLDAQGKYAEAAAQFSKSVALDSKFAAGHFHLGLALKAQGKWTEAKKSLERARGLEPGHPSFIIALANLLTDMGQAEDALKLQQEAVKIHSGNAALYNSMGATLGILGRWDEAIESYQTALTLAPNDPGTLVNLGNAYKESKDRANAEGMYFKALQLAPDYVPAHFNLGCLYQEEQNNGQAEERFKKALELHPTFLLAHLNLGVLYLDRNRFAEAEQHLRQVVSLNPQFADGYSNLGKLYQMQGKPKQAMEEYKRAFTLNPNHAVAHSNYLFAMHYAPDVTPQMIADESFAWGEKHANSIPHMAHKNIADPEKRLKIGYVSADMRKHPAMAYLEPVLKEHDKTQFEIYCYANHEKDDAVTERLRAYADHWRSITKLSDEQAATLINNDGIDILLDLSGHTAGNRLLVFARKPAPIQMGWIGYFNTTGLKAMDYFIVNRYLLPPEEEKFYTEKPLRLSSNNSCYLGHEPAVEIAPLPALANGYITFGCFNALAKLTQEVIELWASILLAVPDSKLLLKNGSFNDAEICARYRAMFEALGVEGSRIQFAGSSAMPEYLAAYNQIDIALDPFPYNGATTTLDTLWMGVPVITLKGDRLVSHIGESMLGSAGLDEWIAASKEEYLNKAKAFSASLPKLSDLRANLRAKLLQLPMMNPALFTRDLEDAYRQVWREWCRKQNK